MSLLIELILCNLLIPVIMIAGGHMMFADPPQDISGFVGYRTKRSRKSREAWTFAQNYCGRVWMIVGGIVLFLTLLAQIIVISIESTMLTTASLIALAVHIIIMNATYIPVEMALKRTFDEDGVRKKDVRIR